MNELDQLLSMVDQSRDEIVGILQDLVRIPTVNSGRMPTGNEIEVCSYLQELFTKEGIESEVLESAPSRGNFIAKMGEAFSPSLLYMSHTDVVPVEDRESWRFPPFSGQVADGKVFGRGSEDQKALVTTSSMALFVLKRAGIRLNGKLLFLGAADEEAGGHYGAGWLAKNEPEKIYAEYAINEGGGTPAKTDRGLAYIFSVGEKGRYEAKFTIKGRSCHSGQPWLGDNAILKANRLIDRIDGYRPDLITDLEFFNHIASHYGLHDPITSDNVDRVAEDFLDRLPDLASAIKTLSRVTISPTMISGGIKSNSIPGTCSLTCDIRTLPGQKYKYVESVLGEILRDVEGVSVEIVQTAVADESPSNTEFTNLIRKATEIALGREVIYLIPGIARGFTDSRFIRSLGTEVYGMEPLTPESDLVRHAHGTDEAMEVENLIFRTKMQVALAYLLLAAS